MYISLASYLWYIGKVHRPRSVATERRTMESVRSRNKRNIHNYPELGFINFAKLVLRLDKFIWLICSIKLIETTLALPEYYCLVFNFALKY